MKRIKFFVLFLTMLVSTISYAQTLSQTFSWNGLTLRYPSNYAITDRETGSDGYSFNCVSADDDVISILTASFFFDDQFLELTSDEVLEVCEAGIDGSFEGMAEEEIRDIQKGTKTVDRSKSYTCIYQPFTTNLAGIPISGKVSVSLQDNMLVIVAMLADDPARLSTLQSITNSIKRKR